MRKKSYLSFKDLRAFYDRKTDTIRLTSGDPNLAAQGWSLTLNRETPAEQILRDELTDAGIIKAEEPTADLSGQISPLLPLEQIDQWIDLAIAQAARDHATLVISASSDHYEATLLSEASDKSVEETVKKGLEWKIPQARGKQIIARLKQIANLTQAKIPQDGKFERKVGGESYLARLGVFPSVNGETVYLRLASPAEDEPAFIHPVSDFAQDKPYLGYTTRTAEEPVFFSLHDATKQGKAPGTIITGSPGSGKTFAAFSLAYQTALQPGYTVYVDPKADAVSLLKLPAMEHGRLFDLKEGYNGMLSPYAIAARSEARQEIAYNVVGLLVGGVYQLTASARAGLLSALVDVSTLHDPSLDQVVDVLLESADPDSKALGAELNLIRQLPFARLMFDKAARRPVFFKPGLTIITMLGLSLPSKSTSPSAYSNANRLSSALMNLLVEYVGQSFKDLPRDSKKTLVLDQAWSVTDNARGLRQLEEMSRMGRALDIAILLVDPISGSPISAGALDNMISTRLAFREVSPDDIAAALKQLKLEPTPFNEKTLRNLLAGEAFLKRDTEHAFTFKVNVDPTLASAFETDPWARKTASRLIYSEGSGDEVYDEGGAQYQVLLRVQRIMQRRLAEVESKGYTRYSQLVNTAAGEGLITVTLQGVEELLSKLPVTAASGDAVTRDRFREALSDLTMNGRRASIMIVLRPYRH